MSTESGDCASEHGFSGAWRAEHQDSFPGLPDACEELRLEDGHEGGLFDNHFGLAQVGDIVEGHFQLAFEHVSLQSVDQLTVRPHSIGILAEQETTPLLLLHLVIVTLVDQVRIV